MIDDPRAQKTGAEGEESRHDADQGEHRPDPDRQTDADEALCVAVTKLASQRLLRVAPSPLSAPEVPGLPAQRRVARAPAQRARARYAGIARPRSVVIRR